MPDEYPTEHGDFFVRYQQTMAHVVGHPRLREVAKALSENPAVLNDRDPKAYLLEQGFALPDDSTVEIDLAADTPHSWHICIAGDAGHFHCLHIQLPEITVTH